MAILDGPQPGEFVQAIYAPFVDYPLLGAIGLFPIKPSSEEEGNGEEQTGDR